MSQMIQREIEYHKGKIKELKSKRTCCYCGSEKYYARGLCVNCYARYKRNGFLEKKTGRSRNKKRNEVDWKVRFYQAVFGSENVDIPQDAEDAIMHILEKLNSRYKDILLFRFKYNLKFADIGEKYGLTRERIRQIVNRALRECRNPANAKIFLIGYAQAEKEKRINEEEFKERIRSGENFSLEEYKLDNRQLNCLMRYGFKCRNDVIDYIQKSENKNPASALLTIRGIGIKSAERIMQKLYMK